MSTQKAKRIMNEVVFRPHYSLGLVISIPGTILVECVLLALLLTGSVHDTGLGYLAGIIGIVLVVMPRWLIRRIRFGATEFVIDRFVLPPRSISYHEVFDLGHSAIKTQQGSIGLHSIINTGELKLIFDDLISKGKISPHQLEGKLIVEERLTVKSALLSLLIAVILSWITNRMRIWPNWSWLTSDLRFWVVWMPIFLLIYWILERRSRSRRGTQAAMGDSPSDHESGL